MSPLDRVSLILKIASWGVIISTAVALAFSIAVYLATNKRDALIEAVRAKDIAGANEQIKQLATRTRQRILANVTFLDSLKGRPKGTAEIWFNSDDAEAYLFARQIFHSLRTGAGWDVRDPVPIPATGVYPGISPSAPLALQAGGSTGLLLRAKKLPRSFGENSAAGALRDALMRGREGGGAMEAMEDRTLPDDQHFIIVVGQKQ